MMQLLKLDEIKCEMEYYPSEYFDEQVSSRYADAMNLGAQFPPIIVSRIEGKLYLVDGFHRLKAHQINKETHIQAEIDGKITDFKSLYIEAVKLNLHHGRALNKYDQDRIIKKLQEFNLKNSEISKLILVPVDKL